MTPITSLPPWLTALSFCRVRITLRALQQGTLRGFYSSLLRGWLGHQMSRLCVCRFLGPTGFARCTLKQQCAWGVFFGDLPSSTALRPYLIELDSLVSDRAHFFAPGETLPVTILLVGRGIAHLDAIVGALMIDNGIVTLGRERVRFQTLSVDTLREDDTPCPYFHDKTRVGTPYVHTVTDLTQHVPQRMTPALEVRLLTPLTIKRGNVLVGKTQAFPFTLLLRAIMRRLYDLATAVCEYQGVKPDFASLLSVAAAIETTHTDLRWIDFSRFSSRQQSRMDFGGLVGSVSFRGEFAQLLPYLLLGGELHIGRHTSFGFGRFCCSFS